MAINGERARVLMREVVRAASDAIPDGVDLEIVGRGRWWVLRKVDPANPAGKVVAHTVLNDGSRRIAPTGDLSPWGIGTWIPFLPRRLDAKLTAISGVEMLQDVVSSATGQPWPGPDYRVRAKVIGRQVATWFEPSSQTGPRVDLHSLPLHLF